MGASSRTLMSKLSVYIIAYNEVEKVAATIESVRGWADEIVLVDSWSTDGTQEVAANLGARVVQVKFEGFGKLRNAAIGACSHEWIFSVDADERCTPEVQREISAIIAGPDSADAYLVPRRNWFMGRWVRHSGWYPNYRQPQLFRAGRMHYDEKPVHEGYVLADPSRPLGKLKSAIWQFPFKDMGEVMHKANRYSTLSAQRVLDRGKTSMGAAFAHGIWAFLKHYVFKLGVLDGWAGFVIAFAYFEQTFYRYVKAVEIQNTAQWKAPPGF